MERFFLEIRNGKFFGEKNFEIFCTTAFLRTVEPAYNGSAFYGAFFHPLQAISAMGDAIFHYSRRLGLEN